MRASDKNILFIMSDQHSFRYQGNRPARNGGENVDTPTIDQLDNTSASFENAYCASPICTPSRLSLLTGKYVPNADAWGNSSLLHPDLETFPETLSKAGYETCLLGKMHLGGNRQFAGFDQRPYGDLTGNAGHQFEPHKVPEGSPDWKQLITEAGATNLPESILQEQNIVTEAVSFIREQKSSNPDQPWVLCASFSRPHWPRTAPERFFNKHWPDNVSEPPIDAETDIEDHPFFAAQRGVIEGVTPEDTLRARAGYQACVEYLDEIIGDFIAVLEKDGLLDDTIVVYTSDHGEMAGEHGLWGKQSPHEASTRVPLFIQTPEHRNGNLNPIRIETPVSLVDLYPTLCSLVDATLPDDLDGEDLSSNIVAESEPERGPIVTDCFATWGSPDTDYRMVRDGSYKYVQFRNAPELLFNIDEDPLEMENLAPDASGDDAESLKSLRRLVDDTLDFEETLTRQKQMADLKDDFRLGTYQGGPNQYHLPDGRIVDADSPLYRPDIVAEEPEVIFDDFPN